ncbi:hypothetical protein B0H16DRAFT_1734481 [Mycena metata]|uniref:Uncharacterized protein n=1 Tax=Mycena metata TaxID=1033252 RepID=A0AAD7HW73_9AGAR|nr:hypothetical protein B0H16DRAFT_1734481 [Mycena metata]
MKEMLEGKGGVVFILLKLYAESNTVGTLPTPPHSRVSISSQLGVERIPMRLVELSAGCSRFPRTARFTRTYMHPLLLSSAPACSHPDCTMYAGAPLSSIPKLATLRPHASPI